MKGILILSEHEQDIQEVSKFASKYRVSISEVSNKEIKKSTHSYSANQPKSLKGFLKGLNTEFLRDSDRLWLF